MLSWMRRTLSTKNWQNVETIVACIERRLIRNYEDERLDEINIA